MGKSGSTTKAEAHSISASSTSLSVSSSWLKWRKGFFMNSKLATTTPMAAANGEFLKANPASTAVTSRANSPVIPGSKAVDWRYPKATITPTMNTATVNTCMPSMKVTAPSSATMACVRTPAFITPGLCNRSRTVPISRPTPKAVSSPTQDSFQDISSGWVEVWHADHYGLAPFVPALAAVDHRHHQQHHGHFNQHAHHRGQRRA